MADEFANLLNGNQQATPSPGPAPSFAQFFNQYQQANPVKSDPFQNEYFDPQKVERYKNSPIYSPWIDPFADNETAAAQAQSGWEALYNGTKGSWDGIKDGFTSSAMVLPRLIGSIFSGSVDGMMDDEYGMRMGEFEQQQNQNENPIYMTADERDDIFSMKAAGEMMQNAGYTIGTFAELATETVATHFLAAAFTGATGGAGGASLAAASAFEAGRWGRFINGVRKVGFAAGEALGGLGKARTAELGAQNILRAKTMAQQAEIISEMGKLRDVQFGSKISENLYKFSTKIPVVGELIETGNIMRTAGKTGLLTKGELASIGVGGIRRAYGEFQAASGEAAIEAGGTYNEVYNHLYEEYSKANGAEPDAEEDRRMRELAKTAATDSYGLNMGTLLLMNKIEFGNIMRNMVPDNAIVRAFKNEALDNITVAGKIGGVDTAQTFTKGTMGRLGVLPEIAATFDNGYRVAAAQFGKGLVAGFKQFSVWEGLQENIQEGTVHGLKKHYQDLYNNDPSTWGEGFQEAVDSQMNKQGLKTFMMGAMTGVVTGPLIMRASKGMEYLQDREGYRTQKEETAKTVAAFNNYMNNHAKVLQEHIRKTKEHNAYGDQMQRAAAENDLFNYLNSRESDLIQAVHSAKRLGNLPLLLDTVRAYGEGFDNQAFKEAFGFTAKDAGYNSPAEFTSRIASDIERYSETYDHYMKKYANFLDLGKYIKDPEKKLVSEIARASLLDAIETVSFHENKAQDAVKRRAGIQSKISQYDSIGQSVSSGFDKLTNLTELKNESMILDNEIRSLEQQEVKSEETERLIKHKKEQRKALNDWTEAIGYTVTQSKDETSTYTYNNEALRQKSSVERTKASDAFKRFLVSKNAEGRINTNVKQEDIDAAMQDIVDYMELGEENRKMVDALNMLNDPIAFNKTMDAAMAARIGAHANNMVQMIRHLALMDPVFGRLLNENEKLIKEAERFADSPMITNQAFAYLAELKGKISKALEDKKKKTENPENDKAKKSADTTDSENVNKDETGNITTSPKALEPENLQMMLDRGMDVQVVSFVNKHYIFKQIAGNRYSFQRVVDSRVPEPVVTHEGELDITENDCFNFAVKFETELFTSNTKGSVVDETILKEARKLKNLVGRQFKTEDGNTAELDEDPDGYVFIVFNPETGDVIEEIAAGDNGEVSYTKVKQDGKQWFTLIPEPGDPTEAAPGDSPSINSVNDAPAVNNEVQQLEDEKENAIRDEKQKLKWQEGKRVMYNGEAGIIQKTQDEFELYFVKLDSGLELTLGPEDSLLEEYPGLSLAPEASTDDGEVVAVDDKVFTVEFTSDDRSTVKIDGKDFTIVRSESTGEITGLAYQTKAGQRVGRNGIFKQYINAVSTSLQEMHDAIAAEEQEALAKELLDAENNSKEANAVKQISDTFPADAYLKFLFREDLTPEEVEALRNSFLNALTLKNESSVQGPLLDKLEDDINYDLNKLNSKYPPDNKPNDPTVKDKKSRKAKRKQKAASKQSSDDAGVADGKKAPRNSKAKSEPTSLQESVEQLELQFEDAKAETRVQTENKNVTPVTPVEQYTSTLDSLVTDLVTAIDEFTPLVNYVERSVETTKKSTKKSTKSRKFEVGTISTNASNTEDTNPFDSLGEAVFCKL
jgi:hypothetical protein